MAQIIQLRRGTLSELNSVTLRNGELGVVSSSVATIGDSVLKTAVVVGNTDGTNRLSIARLVQGSGSAALAGVTGGAAFNDMIYYDTNDFKLQTLHTTNGVTTLDLTGNIAGGTVGGTLDVTGRVDAQAGLDVTGSLNVTGNGTFGGNLTFGDAATDSVSFGADIDSNLIPNTDDTYDLGSAAQAWQDLYLEGDIHLTDAGSIATDAGALTIDGAGGINIGTTADQAIDVDASTFDLDANSTVHLSGSSVTLDGNGVSIAGNASEVDITTTGTVDINSAALDIDASAGLTMTSTTMAFDPSSTFDLDAAGAVTIDGSSISLGTDSDVAFDIDTSTLDIDSSGAVTIDGATGSHFKATGTLALSGSAVTIAGGGGSEIDITTTGGKVDINAGDLDVDTTGAISLDSSAGSIDINVVDGQTVKVGLNGAVETIWTPHGSAASEKWSTTNTAGTATDAVKLIATAGGVDIDSGTTTDILAASTLSAKGATGASFGDDTGTWEFDGSGAVSETGMTTISMTPSSTVDIDAGGAVTIDGTSVTIGADDSGVAISIGHSTSETTVNDNLTVTGDLTVNGTQTTISSSLVDIGDNIIQVNGTPVTYGGLHVKDVTSTETGSMVWNTTSNYWVAGLSGSEYRVPIQNTVSNLSDNKVVIAQANGRIESSANITDNGSTVDFGDVDLTSIDQLQGIDANTYIDLGASTLIVTKGTIQPSAHGGNDLGATGTRYANLWLSANADVDGTLDVAGVADFQSVVDAQASLTVTGSIYVSAGASVAAASASLVSFKNDSNDQLGYLASANTEAVTTGLVGYNASTGNLTISSVVDGGSF